MNLVKWLRKNNRKIMAVVVVFIMISFVLGAALQQLARNVGRNDDAVWLYGQDGQVNRGAQMQAEKELELLKVLGISDNALLSRDPETGRITQQSLSPILLNQFMFANASESSQISRYAKSVIRQNLLMISEDQIDSFFLQTRDNAPLNWILLKAETARLGITFPKSQIKEMLSQSSMSQRINTIARNMSLSKDQVHQIVADFFAVRAYISIMTTSDNVTISQVRNMFNRQSETLDAEFVQFDASVFTDEIDEPTDNEIAEYFGKYKNFIKRQITADNPFGFGYKLPDRVKLDYVLIDIAEVEKQIDTVSEEEAEQFYQDHLRQLVENVRVNPNDPNSEVVQKTIPYAKVVYMIKEQIKRDKIDAKAEEIINSIEDTIEAGFEGLDRETADIEQVRAKSPSYNEVADLASKKFNVQIEAGSTTLVSAEQLMSASVLGGLIQTGKNPVALVKLVFSVEQLGDNHLPFDVSRPKLYDNIGILRDRYNKQIALVRVVDAAKAAAPAGIDTEVKIEMPLNDQPLDISSYVVRGNIIADIKVAKAMKIAETKAQEFIKTLAEKGWDTTIEEFNAKYAKQDSDEPTFKIDQWNGQRRLGNDDVERTRILMASQPGGETMLNRSLAMKQMIDKVYEKFEQDSFEVAAVPFTMEFESQSSVVVFKSLSRSIGNQAEFEKSKNDIVLAVEARNAQSVTIALLMPENLKKRIDLRFAEPKDKKQEVGNEK